MKSLVALFIFSAFGSLTYAMTAPPVLAQSPCNDSESAPVQFKTRVFLVQKIRGAILFSAGMEVDADGAPNAYGPNNKGLDFTANAKNGEKFVGVVTDAAGKPILQQSGAFKGFYVSPTSLRAAGASKSDPSTYVDATKMAYIALPPELVKQFEVALGDLAVVTNVENGKSSFAMYADAGPHSKIGEGSVALANALGLKGNPRHGGTEKPIIAYLVFPKSGLGQGKLRTREEINDSAGKMFQQWGGMEHLKGCLPQRDSKATEVPSSDQKESLLR